jgi:hypothetical protein
LLSATERKASFQLIYVFYSKRKNCDEHLAVSHLGYAERSLVAVRPPENGVCTCLVDKLPPVALINPFTCSSTGWTDPNGKLINLHSFYCEWQLIGQ